MGLNTQVLRLLWRVVAMKRLLQGLTVLNSGHAMWLSTVLHSEPLKEHHHVREWVNLLEEVVLSGDRSCGCGVWRARLSHLPRWRREALGLRRCDVHMEANGFLT